MFWMFFRVRKWFVHARQGDDISLETRFSSSVHPELVEGMFFNPFALSRPGPVEERLSVRSPCPVLSLSKEACRRVRTGKTERPFILSLSKDAD
jgi:hypothetical protein